MMVRMRVVAVCVLAVLTGGAVRAQSPGTATGSVSSAVAREDESGQVQVCVETRMITMATKLLPPGVYDPIRKQWQSDFLDDEQVRALVRTSQTDRGGSLVTSPRVTVFDGGEASVDVTTPHRYRDIKATTRPDGSQEYSMTPGDTWDGIRENIRANTDAGHNVARIKFRLTIQKVWGMDTVQTKPTHPDDKPIEFEQPRMHTFEINTDIAVPNGKTAVVGGQILESEDAQERAMVVLVKPTIIGDPSTQPAVPLPQKVSIRAGTVAPSQVAPEEGRQAAQVVAATRPDGPSAIIVRVYEVGDLLTWEKAHVEGTTIEDVQDLIMTEVEPQSWVEDGPGRMQAAQGNMLVVWHTAAGHERIAQFIKKKTEEMVQVLIETKVVAIDKQKVEAVLLDPATKKSGGNSISIGQTQAEELMRIGENYVVVPRVTVFDGVKAHVDVSTEKTYVGSAAPTTRPDGTVELMTRPETVWEGFRMDVIAKTMKDRKSVRLQIEPKLQKVMKMEPFEFKLEGKGERLIQIQSPVTWTVHSANDVTVPDGQWICLGGQTIPDDHAGVDGAARVQILLVKATIIGAPGVGGAK